MNRDLEFLIEQPTEIRNLGDHIIFRELVSLLSRFGIPVISGIPLPFLEGPKHISGKWRIRSYRLIKKLSGTKVVRVSAPGGMTTVNSVPRSSSLKTYLSSALENFLSEPQITLGISVMPDSNHCWLKRKTCIGVRDTVSLAELRPHHGKSVFYFPDLSFLVQNKLSEQNQTDRSGFAFSFRGNFSEGGSNQKVYLNRLCKSVELIANSLTMEEKCNSVSYFQVDRDERLSVKISQDYGLNFEAHQLTFETFRKFYDKQKYVISNRLHCLLFAAAFGALPIALTSPKHTKLVSLFETIGCEELIISIDNPDDVVEQMNAIRKNSDQLLAKVKSAMLSQKKLANKTIQEVMGTLGLV
jgi:polysaccharide pyruvyl transferase WcaK-like protein